MSSSQPSPNQERFNAEEAAGSPLMTAVENLAEQAGSSIDEMQKLTMGEILQLAERTYEELPAFWTVWKDWTGPDQFQPMGDL